MGGKGQQTSNHTPCSHIPHLGIPHIQRASQQIPQAHLPHMGTHSAVPWSLLDRHYTVHTSKSDQPCKTFLPPSDENGWESIPKIVCCTNPVSDFPLRVTTFNMATKGYH